MFPISLGEFLNNSRRSPTSQEGRQGSRNGLAWSPRFRISRSVGKSGEFKTDFPKTPPSLEIVSLFISPRFTKPIEIETTLSF
jgi:hypothetical protein